MKFNHWQQSQRCVCSCSVNPQTSKYASFFYLADSDVKHKHKCESLNSLMMLMRWQWCNDQQDWQETTVVTKNTPETEQRLQRVEKTQHSKNKPKNCMFERSHRDVCQAGTTSGLNHSPNRNQSLRAGASLGFLGGRIIGGLSGHVCCRAESVLEITGRICLTKCYPVLWDGKYSTLMCWFFLPEPWKKNTKKHKCIHEQQR